jgi:hypothetical protein
MWLPDGDPIPRIGEDTRERWMARDMPRAELERFVNAACELGWEFVEAYTIAEAEPPLVAEVVRVWCTAQIAKPRQVRKKKAPQPVDA